MILGLGFIILGGFALYFTITGADPVEALRRALLGLQPPEPLQPGGRPGADPRGLSQDFPPGRRVQPVDPGANEGTPQLQTAIGIALAIPGAVIGTIKGPGSVPGSEHPHGNAVDIGGPRPVLIAVFNALLMAARAGAPIHCIIGPSSRPDWPKGQIRSRESRWKPSEYTGPNSHQTHVHVSGWPSVGGGC